MLSDCLLPSITVQHLIACVNSAAINCSAAEDKLLSRQSSFFDCKTQWPPLRCADIALEVACEKKSKCGMLMLHELHK